MRIPRLAAATVLTLTIAAFGAGCAEEAPDPASMTDRPTMAGVADAIPAEAATLLADYGLDQMTSVEIVNHLDRLDGPARPADLMASVRPTELLLSAGGEEHALALPANKFYVSIAPYVEETHECFYHSLTTCKGELGDTDVHVTVLADTGAVLVDEDVRTFGNGFTGFWLPHNVEGTITVTYADKSGAHKSGTVDFTTTDEGATCVSNLRLT